MKSRLQYRRQAAELLARQPAKQARPAILKLLQNPRTEDTPAVAAALVNALCACGYDKSNWKTVEAMFERSYAPECVQLQEAILNLAATHKETQALKLLLRNLDETNPENCMITFRRCRDTGLILAGFLVLALIA